MAQYILPAPRKQLRYASPCVRDTHQDCDTVDDRLCPEQELLQKDLDGRFYDLLVSFTAQA
jgi:hypothetical protein